MFGPLDRSTQLSVPVTITFPSQRFLQMTRQSRHACERAGGGSDRHLHSDDGRLPCCAGFGCRPVALSFVARLLPQRNSIDWRRRMH